jgi:hypothetical protein
MFEYIIVEFNEERLVMIDDLTSTYKTDQVIELEPGTHTISLAGEKNFSPSERDITPSGTTSLQPDIVTFTLV